MLFFVSKSNIMEKYISNSTQSFNTTIVAHPKISNNKNVSGQYLFNNKNSILVGWIREISVHF